MKKTHITVTNKYIEPVCLICGCDGHSNLNKYNCEYTPVITTTILRYVNRIIEETGCYKLHTCLIHNKELIYILEKTNND